MKITMGDRNIRPANLADRDYKYRVPYTLLDKKERNRKNAVILYANDKGEALAKAKQYMQRLSEKYRKQKLRIKWGRPEREKNEKTKKA